MTDLHLGPADYGLLHLFFVITDPIPFLVSALSSSHRSAPLCGPPADCFHRLSSHSCHLLRFVHLPDASRLHKHGGPQFIPVTYTPQTYTPLVQQCVGSLVAVTKENTIRGSSNTLPVIDTESTCCAWLTTTLRSPLLPSALSAIHSSVCHRSCTMNSHVSALHHPLISKRHAKCVVCCQRTWYPVMHQRPPPYSSNSDHALSQHATPSTPRGVVTAPSLGSSFHL